MVIWPHHAASYKCTIVPVYVSLTVVDCEASGDSKGAEFGGLRLNPMLAKIKSEKKIKSI